MQTLKISVLLLVIVFTTVQCSKEPIGPEQVAPAPGARGMSQAAVGDWMTLGDKGLPGDQALPRGPGPWCVIDPINPQQPVPDVVQLPPTLQLRKGDLVFCKMREAPGTCLDVPGFDHVAIFVGNGLCIEAACIGLNHWVRPISLFLLRGAADVTYGRVKNALPADRDSACAFARTQLWREYQYVDDYPCVNHDPDDPEDEFSDRWYNSELVWACWYRQGFDIADVGPEPYPCTYVSPQDIADDDDVEILDIGGISQGQVGGGAASQTTQPLPGM